MPICVKEETVRPKSGGPLLNYVEKKQVYPVLSFFFFCLSLIFFADFVMFVVYLCTLSTQIFVTS